MNSKIRFLTFLLSAFFCVMQAMAAVIPTENIGEGKWVTLKAANGYYFCAIKENDTYKLGQSNVAPTASNYAAYCWKISGNDTEGYSFRCLGYMDYANSMDYSKANEPQQELYITNPTTIATNNHEVLLTSVGSKYIYTDNHQLRLKETVNLYLAYYSQNYHTIRLHNSADYIGSKMIIGGINDWSVAAVVYGTETVGSDGLPQGTYLPNGGVTSGGQSYVHGSSLYLNDESLSKLSLIPVSGFDHSTIKIDKENRYIVAYYIGQQSGINYKNASIPVDGNNAVIGENNTIWTLEAKNYITNTSINADGTKKYTTVPANKAWEMEVVVNNTNTSGSDPSFNQWGSCILASNGDPLNTYYWGDFQIYQHSSTHKSPNTLNFKSSKADGYDHIIAEGVSVANKNYKVLVRYNGTGVYVIRTIILDEGLNETNLVYNNVWVSARNQNEISQMSCALPAGINIKSLRISIAEESNLLEGVDYAIQNLGTSEYLNGGISADGHSIFAGDAAKYQIEWTNSEDLTYTDSDGGLHHSFYMKVLQNDNSYKYIGDGRSKTAFVYSENSKQIQPISAKNDVGAPWTINSNTTWLFDFFANFYVEVAGNNTGGLLYQKGGEQHTATNGQYLELPAGVQTTQLANSSQAGYMAAITKADIRLKVQYTPLENTFYTITPKTAGATPALYYWYKDRTTPSLITSSTTNTLSGQPVEWGDKGDCSKYTITKSPSIPVKMTKVGGKYYGTIYCPNALTLPTGVTAYRLDDVEDAKSDGSEAQYCLLPLEGSILPAKTPVVLISEASSDPSGNWTVNASNPTTMSLTNLFSGVFEDIANPGSGQKDQSTIYALGNKNGIAFYPYSGQNVPAFKAYHEITTSAPARFLFALPDEDATVIEHPDSFVSSSTGIYYDLTGRVVTVPVRGHIYIHNGTKVLY